ncbi:hypothetical protein ACTXG5_25420 [Mycobacterium sp. Dal123C01]|uniref:hypothetical protein n=1 Tax=Mycobacterium sp. Dal123C01 TaxID=3457577 RepID=UPI00403EE2AC
MRSSSDRTHNPLGEYVLHLGVGFVARERPHVLAALATLKQHLGRWDPADIGLEVSLQDRGRREQRVTLRTTLPGLPPLVAVADDRDITRALHGAKHELIWQLEHQKSAREPMHNRQVGHNRIRHPGTSAQGDRIPPAL